MEQRIDFSEFIRRINKQSDKYEAAQEDAFISDGEWFLFVSAAGQDDILINAKEDENKLLTSVSVSVINTGIDRQDEVFVDFCRRAVTAFTENADSEKILEDSHLLDENIIFSDEAYFSENGRFKTSFYNAELGSTFLIELLY